MTQNTRASCLGGRVARRGVVIAVVALAAVLGIVGAWSHLGDSTPTSLPTAQAAGSVGSIPSYTSDVSPILVRSCFRCHGPDRADKGLRLDSYQRVMAGDSYGAILIPGDSSLSAMVLVIKNGTMPHESTKLTPAEIDTLSRWIDAGAPQN
jgi:hypothetical protein